MVKKMLKWPQILYYISTTQRTLSFSREQLINMQNKKLRYLIKHSYDNVPLYKHIFKENNISPSDINNINDLNKIPIIRKETLKSEPINNQISFNNNYQQLIKLTTGGSTGEPLSTYITRKEKDWRTAIHLRSNINCGHKIHYQWATIDNVETYQQNRQMVKLFPHSSLPILWHSDKQLNTLYSIKPHVLDGLSSALWLLARNIKSKEITEISPKIMFGTGELISVSSRKEIENSFNSTYFDQLSCSEVGRTAWECPEKTGYHMNVDSTIIQFIDDDGEDVAPGERGELVYTSLHNLAMPLIRYGIQDIGIPLEDGCPCGVTLPMMKMIEGRHNSFIVFPSGHIVSPWRLIETLKLFILTDDIEKYRIIQHKKDHIEIKIVKTNDKVNEQSIKKWIELNLKKEFTEDEVQLSDLQIEISFVDTIPSTKRGKLNVISSKLQDIPIF
jgi:phenylacetate-CoA ligase